MKKSDGYFPLDRFTDHAFQEEYEKISEGTSTIETLVNQAKDLRKSEDKKDHITCACIYLVCAQKTLSAAENLPEENPPEKKDANKLLNDLDDVTRYFHFAGNEFRKIDMLERSAQSYLNSAIRAFRICKTKEDKPTIEMGLRSAGRAKGLFSELGEEEKFDRAHVLRLNLKYLLSKITKKRFYAGILLMWRTTTMYGTSIKRWSTFLAIVLIAFTIGYLLLINADFIKIQEDLPNSCWMSSLTTSFFLSFINLVSFGAYTNITPISVLGEIALIVHSIFSFIIIGTGVTFLTKR